MFLRTELDANLSANTHTVSVHVPVSKTDKILLNFKFGSKSISSPSWDIEVIHQKCEDNLVRKYGNDIHL